MQTREASPRRTAHVGARRKTQVSRAPLVGRVDWPFISWRPGRYGALGGRKNAAGQTRRCRSRGRSRWIRIDPRGPRLRADSPRTVVKVGVEVGDPGVVIRSCVYTWGLFVSSMRRIGLIGCLRSREYPSRRLLHDGGRCTVFDCGDIE